MSNELSSITQHVRNGTSLLLLPLLGIKWVATKISNYSQELVLSILDLQMNSNKRHGLAEKLILKGS